MEQPFASFWSGNVKVALQRDLLWCDSGQCSRRAISGTQGCCICLFASFAIDVDTLAAVAASSLDHAKGFAIRRSQGHSLIHVLRRGIEKFQKLSLVLPTNLYCELSKIQQSFKDSQVILEASKLPQPFTEGEYIPRHVRHVRLLWITGLFLGILGNWGNPDYVSPEARHLIGS